MSGPDEPAQIASGSAKYSSDSKQQAFEKAKKRINRKLSRGTDREGSASGNDWDGNRLQARQG